MELQFRVTKQSIKRTDGQTPVSDSVNYLTAEFTFDSSDWDNTTKTATFRSGVSVYTVLLDSNNKCVVPWELIKAGKLKVSVYGDGANEYRITADSIDVPVYASGFSLGEESQHPTPDQYEQLTGALAEKVGVSNLKTINGNSLVGEGDIIIEGGGASIDDVTATTYTVYSSEKVALMVGAKPSINDEEASTASVYSSAETDLLLASKLNTNGVKTINGESIVGEGNITIEGGGASINDTTATTTSVYSSEKTVEIVSAKPSIDDATVSTASVYSSNKINNLLTTESGNILPTGMLSGKAIRNWGAGSTTYNDLQDNAQYYTYPITEVEPNTEYSLYSNTGSRYTGAIVGLYNSSGVAISFLGMATSVITTAETKYIRFSSKSADITQVRKGNDAKAKAEAYGNRYEKYLEDEVVEYKMTYIHVSTTGSNVTGDGSKGRPYATPYFANNQITDNSASNRYTIVLEPGTYNMSSEISGVPTHDYEGIIAKDYVYYESTDISRPDLCKIYLDGSDGLSGATLTDENLIPKCIFHFVGNKEDSSKRLHTHVKGMTLESTNARYGLHGETVATVGQDVLHENIVVIWHGKPAITGVTNSNILGYGMVCNDHITFRNCKFVVDGEEEDKRTFIAHDNNLKNENINKIGGVVTFESCDMLGLLNGLMHTASSLPSVDVPFVFRCIGCTNVGTVAMQANWGKYVETITTS